MPEEANPSKGQKIVGGDMPNEGLVLTEPAQQAFQEETAQLPLPFDKPDIATREKPISKPRKRQADQYKTKQVQAQRYFLKNQPRQALNLLKDLDFEPIPSSQRWRIAALRGHCYFGLGMFLPARADYIYAIKKMPEDIPEDQLQEAMSVHLYLAAAQRELGNLNLAAEHYHIALAQMDAGAQVRHFAEANWGLALIKIEQVSRIIERQELPTAKEKRMLQDALIYAERAKTLYESTGEMLNAVSVACDIASMEQMAGNFDNARKHLQDILKDWTPMLTISHNQKRLSQYRNVVSLAYCSLAEVELAAHNEVEALAYAKLGHETAQKSNTLRRAQASILLGKVLSTSNKYSSEAEMAFHQAIDILSSTELLNAQIHAHEMLGHYLIKQARVVEAKHEFDLAQKISLTAQGISKHS